MINKVLIQYKNIFGAKKYKEFFKSKEAALAELYSKMPDLFESTHMSCEFGDRIIVEIVEPIVDELTQKYKLRKDDFYLSSGANSGVKLFLSNLSEIQQYVTEEFKEGFIEDSKKYKKAKVMVALGKGKAKEDASYKWSEQAAKEAKKAIKKVKK